VRRQLDDLVRGPLKDADLPALVAKRLNETAQALPSAAVQRQGATVQAGVRVPSDYASVLEAAGARERLEKQSGESGNNLQQVALAVINFADQHRGLMPPAVVYDQNGKPLYSWRVLILPYLQENKLYQEFRLNEAWDSEHNKKLLARMPKVYAPTRSDQKHPAHSTYFQVFDGKEAAFYSDPKAGLRPFNLLGVQGLSQGGSGRRFPASFTDGTSNTLLVVEAGEAVPWTKPADLPYAADKPIPKLGGQDWPPGFLAALADGSVRFIGKKMSERTLRAAITPMGGEVLGSDWSP
jgi:hypothetical protein